MRYFPLLSALCVSVLMLALGIPLAMGRVAPNGIYGFRTAKTLSSPSIWYRANAYAGKAFILAGVLSIVAALLCLLLTRRGTLSSSASIVMAVLIEVVPVLVASAISALYVSRI